MNAEQQLIQKLKCNPQLNQIKIDNFNINYITAGKGNPLILLHGANMGWGQWYANIDELAKNFTVYALDMPGAGKSTKLPYRDLIPEKHFVELTEKFIELKKLENINIIAHSIGAWVTLRLILREKSHISRVILINPMGFSTKNPLKYSYVGFYPLAKLLVKTIIKIRPFSMKKFVESGFVNPQKMERIFFDYYYENIKNSNENHPLLLLNKLTDVLKVKKEFVLLKMLYKIKIPVLIVAGKYDGLVQPHQQHLAAFKLIPKCKIEIMSDSGHVPFIEESEKFNKLVNNFLTN